MIYHFDTVVLQQAYQQYNDFNFFYLFLTSVGLLTVTHVFNVIYWVLARNREETKVIKQSLPLIFIPDMSGSAPSL